MAEYMIDVPHQKIKAGEKHICPECFHYRVCMGRVNRPCIECDCYVPSANVRVVGPVLTKGDEIRAMSDEELAEFCMAQQAGVLYKACEMFGIKPEYNETKATSEWLAFLRRPKEEPCK